MTALPTHMTDRWRHRNDPAPGEDTLYWHVLMGGCPKVVELAREARDRLAQFSGLHMTPLERLHLTTLAAGPASAFTGRQLNRMTEIAAGLLADIAPITVTLGCILYHPQAIMLDVSPAGALTPIRNAAARATRLASEPEVRIHDSAWIPHITICYSTADQPAAPIIAALGEHLPQRNVEITGLSLVIQHGPERNWDWSTLATIELVEKGRNLTTNRAANAGTILSNGQPQSGPETQTSPEAG